MNKGQFTKKNAKEIGSRGGKKTLRKYGKNYFRQLRNRQIEV